MRDELEVAIEAARDQRLVDTELPWGVKVKVESRLRQQESPFFSLWRYSVRCLIWFCFEFQRHWANVVEGTCCPSSNGDFKPRSHYHPAMRKKRTQRIVQEVR